MRMQMGRNKRSGERLESKRIGTFAVVYSVILIPLCAILQTTLFERLAVSGISFDSTILVAVFLAIYTNEYYGSVFGLVLGTLADMIYPTPFPMMPIVYLVLCAVCGTRFREMKRGFFIQKLGAAFICVAIRSGVMLLLRAFTFDDPIGYIFSYEIPHFLYTVCAMPIFMLICAPSGKATLRN